MRKVLLTAVFASVFVISGCASGEPEATSYDKEEWCGEYNTVLTLNADLINDLAESNVKFTPELVDRVIGIADEEYALAFNGEVVLGPEMVASREKANQIITESFASIRENSEQAGPIADIATKKDYLDMITSLEELAKGEGYASLDAYVEDYVDTVKTQCGYDIGEIVTGEKTA